MTRALFHRPLRTRGAPPPHADPGTARRREFRLRKLRRRQADRILLKRALRDCPARRQQLRREIGTLAQRLAAKRAELSKIWTRAKIRSALRAIRLELAALEQED